MCPEFDFEFDLYLLDHLKVRSSKFGHCIVDFAILFKI